MINIPLKVAAAEESASGIGAFNINLKAFLFQLATFVIVLLILRRWVFPKLTATIEARRQTLEASLKHAKQTEAALASAEQKASQILQQARDQADRSLAEAASQSKDIVAKAESAAEVRAARLLAEAEERLAQEKLKLQEELKGELAELVVLTTEKLLAEKIDARRDRQLIERSIKELVV